MAATMSSRGVTAIRLCTVFLILSALFFSRSFWWPSATIEHWHTKLGHTGEGAEPAKEPSTPEAVDPSHEVDIEPVLEEHTEIVEPPAAAATAITTTTSLTSSAVSTSLHATTPTTSPLLGTDPQHECMSRPGAENVQIIYKTGATELYEKMSMHVLTLIDCLNSSNVLIFSDLAQNIDGLPVYDALEPVSKKYKEEHENFELYRKQHEYQIDGLDVAKLKGDKGWDLDKWKFLPLTHMTYEKAPEHIDWFVFIEADTSLSWLNLMLWLPKLDPKETLYMGAVNMIGDTAFGHGGSGYVLSRPAIKKLYEYRKTKGTQSYDEEWEEITSNSCCGDEVLARALLDAGVPVTAAWPNLQGEKIPNVDWTDRHWCSAPVTWHHIFAFELDILWKYEIDWIKQHGWDTPYLYREMFHEFVEDHIRENRTAWNNLSHERKIVHPNVRDKDSDQDAMDWKQLSEDQRKSTRNFDECAAECERLGKDCLQWSWSPGRCYLGHVIQLGMPDEREEEQWQSGWRQGEIEAFIQRQEPCKTLWDHYND